MALPIGVIIGLAAQAVLEMQKWRLQTSQILNQRDPTTGERLPVSDAELEQVVGRMDAADDKFLTALAELAKREEGGD